MEQSYARALWNMVNGGMEPRKAVHAIRDVLAKSGREALMPRIARAFERIAQRELSKSSAILTIAKEGDEKHAMREAKAVMQGMEIEIPLLKTQVDDTLIGGWRLEAKGQLIDASYKSKLLDVFNAATR